MCIRMEMGNVQNGVGNELRKKGRGGERGGKEEIQRGKIMLER